MYKPIIIYGAGELGKLASQFFNYFEIPYTVCDDCPDNYRLDSYWNLGDIININELFNGEDYLVLVCISTVSYNMIKEKLNNKGFTNVRSFYEYAEQINKASGYKHPLTNGWKHNYKFLVDKKIKKITNVLYFNYKSYLDYYQFFVWHKNYEEFSFHEINCDNRYFIPEVVSVLHDHEVFIDAGAYDGRVTKKFIDIVKGKYDEIRCFEPDTYNYHLMQEDFYENELTWRQNILIYPEALGNKCGSIKFKSGFNYLSKVNKKSTEKKSINKLDNYLDNYNGFKPTFIKYHLEGYELEALKGSIKTIKKHRPIVIVTTYHTEDGLYKIPLWLIKNCKDYNFYWRNHNYQGQGAVMYCVPKERSK